MADANSGHGASCYALMETVVLGGGSGIRVPTVLIMAPDEAAGAEMIAALDSVGLLYVKEVKRSELGSPELLQRLRNAPCCRLVLDYYEKRNIKDGVNLTQLAVAFSKLRLKIYCNLLTLTMLRAVFQISTAAHSQSSPLNMAMDLMTLREMCSAMNMSYFFSPYELPPSIVATALTTGDAGDKKHNASDAPLPSLPPPPPYAGAGTAAPPDDDAELALRLQCEEYGLPPLA